MSAVNELLFKFPPGPVAYVNFAAVFVGSMEPPFHDRQLLHMALIVKFPFSILVPPKTRTSMSFVYEGSTWPYESRGLRVMFFPVESEYAMNIKESSILSLPNPIA